MNNKITKTLTDEDYLYLSSSLMDMDHKLVKFGNDYYLLDNHMAYNNGEYFMERLTTGSMDIFRVDSANDTIHDGYKIIASTGELTNMWKLDKASIEAMIPSRKTYTNEDVRASMLFMAKTLRFIEKGLVGTLLESIDLYSQAIQSEWIASIQMKEAGTVISGGLRSVGEIGGPGLIHHTTWIPRPVDGKIIIKSIR